MCAPNLSKKSTLSGATPVTSEGRDDRHRFLSEEGLSVAGALMGT